MRSNGSRKKRRLSADDIDELIEAADDDKVRRFWQMIKDEKLRHGASGSDDTRRRKFLSIPLYNNTIVIVFTLVMLSFSISFISEYITVGIPFDMYITQPALLIVFAFSAIMFHRYVSDKEEIVGMLDEVAGYSIENESIFENIGSALIVVDATGKITKVNHKAEEILGASAHEITGKSCQVISVDQQLSSLRLQTLRSSQPIVNHNVEWHSGRGYNYSFQVTTSLLQNKKGHTIGAVEVINDITELNHLQEKLKLNEHLASIGELAAKLGHEVGNSLSGIGLFADNLMSELMPEDHRREYVAEILAEIERLKSKVSGIKDYARPISLDLRKSDLNELVSEATLFLRDRIQENGISVKRDLDQTLSEIMIDPDRVRGALLNIIINATEAMMDGGKLTISTRRQNGSVNLSVSDTGSGIPEEIRSKIFNPFFTTKKALGTGLGLSIVCKSIQAHGGTLEFDSEEGKGTTFTMKFPAEMLLVNEQYAESLTH